ncbi:hypothetical protein JRG66_09680 [Salinimicrobium tongyeongense]|uniref:Calx-beta domain-containing protein n=1 Tax=Salinimicrobium tongyeongense TaxID=2809707 RepID=A0ABY6NNJ4_9FLAO|nr:hypothetical protein [Salinimicrobium tongyeongense]UZH54266.1 hypothetical protein JRG66_09680 [Salinimicrobium tongyeongense]
MKNKIFKLSTLVLLAVAFVGCEEDPLIYDVNNGQTLAEFSSSSGSIPVAEEGGSTTVEVAVSTRSSSDRSIEVEIDEENTTATPDQYEISNLVIPANSFVGTITITADFDAIPETGSSVLALDLVGIEGSDASITLGEYEVEMFRWCTTTLDEYVGTWSGPGSWSEHYGYQTEVETFLNDNGELMMTGLAHQWLEGPEFWGEQIIDSAPVKVDVNLETGELSIAEQYHVTTLYDGDEYEYTVSATGAVLNSCEKVLQIFPVLKVGGDVINPAAYGGVKFKETITLDTVESNDPGEGDGSSEE